MSASEPESVVSDPSSVAGELSGNTSVLVSESPQLSITLTAKINVSAPKDLKTCINCSFWLSGQFHREWINDTPVARHGKKNQQKLEDEVPT